MDLATKGVAATGEIGLLAPVVPRPADGARRSARLAGRRRVRVGLLFVSPWLIGFMAFYAYPFFMTAYYSLTDFHGVGTARFVGLANYSALVHDGLFKTSLFNTFYYTAIELPLSTVIALGLALLLNLNVRARGIYRTIFYIPSVVPVVATCMIFVWLFNPTSGIVNALLNGVHVPGPDWFFSATWSKPSFILLGLWGLGQPMVIYLAGLQGVPKEMYEVAKLEGAGPWQKLRHVTVPMISPIILFNVVLQLVACVSYFTQPFLIESSTQVGGPGTSTWFYVEYLYEQAFEFLKFGYSSAMGFILFLVTAAITMALFRSSKRWVYYAGEQG